MTTLLCPYASSALLPCNYSALVCADGEQLQQQEANRKQKVRESEKKGAMHVDGPPDLHGADGIGGEVQPAAGETTDYTCA